MKDFSKKLTGLRTALVRAEGPFITAAADIAAMAAAYEAMMSAMMEEMGDEALAGLMNQVRVLVQERNETMMGYVNVACASLLRVFDAADGDEVCESCLGLNGEHHVDCEVLRRMLGGVTCSVCGGINGEHNIGFPCGRIVKGGAA